MPAVIQAVIQAVYAGQIAPQQFGNRVKHTAIAKRALTGEVRVTTLGIAGDEQGDKKHHGGPTQALCVYPAERYPYWEQRLARPLPVAAFGENFLTTGLVEDEVCIGDVFRAGSTLLQVTQPRGPCATLAAYLQQPLLAAWAQENGFTGWYMRVVQPGTVSAGDALVLEDRPGTGITVMDVNRALWNKGRDGELTARVLSEDLLLGKWRAKLRKFAPAAEHSQMQLQ